MKEVSVYRGGIIAKAYYKRAKSTVHRDIPVGVEKKGAGGLSARLLLYAGQQTVSWAGCDLLPFFVMASQLRRVCTFLSG